ncbi:MAG: glycosyltransferase family 4 protein [Terrimicrobiaceae bacterium]
MNIGVIDLASGGWTAGGVFSSLVAEALQLRRDESDTVSLVSAKEEPSDLPRIRPRRARYGRGEYFLRKLTGHLKPARLPFTADEHGLDVLLPVIYPTAEEDIAPRGRCASIGWIPDFQHARLPEFFDPGEIENRKEGCRRCARWNDLVLLSSESVRRDFEKELPQFAAKARVLPFPSSLALSDLPETATDFRIRLGVPEKYLLVANQFWAHKNHDVVIQAMSDLRRRGHPARVVFVGNMFDHRNSEQCVASTVLQSLSRHDLGQNVRMLGRVSHADLVSLLRHAGAVLQPSRFEGWSTTVQDAKALGRPLICSDIPTHREQAPQASFFPVDDYQKLAEVMAGNWETLDFSYQEAKERMALEDERKAVALYGDALWKLCREARDVRDRDFGGTAVGE